MWSRTLSILPLLRTQWSLLRLMSLSWNPISWSTTYDLASNKVQAVMDLHPASRLLYLESGATRFKTLRYTSCNTILCNSRWRRRRNQHPLLACASFVARSGRIIFTVSALTGRNHWWSITSRKLFPNRHLIVTSDTILAVVKSDYFW